MLASHHDCNAIRSAAAAAGLLVLMLVGEAAAQTPADTAAALRQQIYDAFHAGDSSVTIPPGVYEVASGGGNVILQLPGLSDFTINATGVHLVAKELKQVVRLEDAANVTVNGLTIDYDPLPFTQGTVTRVSASSFDVQIHDGYQMATGSPRVIAYDAATRRVKDGTTTRFNVGMSSLGSRRVRINRGEQDALAAGDLVSLTVPTEIPHGILVADSTQVTLQDVTLHASTSFGVFERGGGGNTYNNIRVSPGPTPLGATQPRLLSANADGFHSKHTSTGPSISGAFITGQGDDGIAINTDFHLVGSASSVELEVGAKNSDLWFEVGDRVRGYNRGTGSVTEAIVESIVRDPSLDAGLASLRDATLPDARSSLDTGYRVTLDRPLDVTAGDLIASPDRSGNGYEIRDSRIENHRARGMLLKASNGLVENNTIDGSTIGGIVLLAEPFVWQEASFSENVVIRGNTIKNTGRQFGSPTNPVAGAIVVNARDGWIGRDHANIQIDGNLIERAAGPGVILNQVDGVQVVDNHFFSTHDIDTTNGSESGIDPTALIWVDNAENVSLSGNTARSLGPFNDNLIRASSNASGLSSRDTGVRVIHDSPARTMASYRGDFQVTAPATGWQYLWNSGGAVGDPTNYEPLVSTGGDYTSDGSPAPTDDPAARFARLGRNNGHAATGSDQSGSGGTSRAVIAAYTVDADGDYAIRDSFVMSNANGSGLELTIHVNDGATLLTDFIESGATASFDVELGGLSAGDTVYVAFGAGDFSTSDFFALDFSVALLVPPGDFNRDGVVDTADYTLWRDMVGRTGIDLAADVTGEDLQGVPDGIVDGSDYALWRANFGRTASTANALVARAPEPRAMTLTAFVLIVGMLRTHLRSVRQGAIR
ncbi:MAG: right-handed parallel beta-helix repeat-containing protein [Planctomycetota bacterium]